MTGLSTVLLRKGFLVVNSIDQYMLRTKNAIRLFSKSKNIGQKNQAICQELGFRLMIIKEAQEKNKEIAELVFRQDTQALKKCIFFLRQVANTDGPGCHDIPFKDSVREKDKEFPEKMNGLIEIINSFDGETLKSESLYKKKCEKLIEAICDYAFYHREIYMPTAPKKENKND